MSVSHLFPVETYKFAFTTNPSVKAPNILNVPLSDDNLGVHKVSSRTTHRLVVPPHPSTAPHDSTGHLPPLSEPILAYEAFYPKGSTNPSAPLPGGFGFYLNGPPKFSSLLDAGASEVILSYRVMFEKGWEWAKGGKLPGIFGGVGDRAYKCSGGRHDERCKCFDFRLMWRQSGLGEIYAYVPPTPPTSNIPLLLTVPPKSVANADFGVSVGRGAFSFEKGEMWLSVAIRVKLNDADSENGEVELWIDGKSVTSVAGLVLRVDGDCNVKIKGLHFQTFFGGHSPDWASPRDQRAWFSDVSGCIIR